MSCIFIFGTTKRYLGRSTYLHIYFWDYEAVPREIPLLCIFTFGTTKRYLGRSPCGAYLRLGLRGGTSGDSPIVYLHLGLRGGTSGALLLFTSIYCVVTFLKFLVVHFSVISLYYYIFCLISFYSSRALA